MNMASKPSRLRGDRVTLAHGGGGRAMRDLIEEVFTQVFQPESGEDQAEGASPDHVLPGDGARGCAVQW